MFHDIRSSASLKRSLAGAFLVLLVLSPVKSADADAVSTLVVTIKPQRAVDDGAKWRYLINGVPSQWLPSGYKVTGLDDGDIVIEASQPPQSSPCKPPNRDVFEIRPGRAHLRELDYSSAACK